ncbi:STAS domain-containing protein [Saccharospirillum salsuginis]|uniref:STAS domain-containing protein n=1 Tax=Saccharospirillum salsuginis TaxID=418750 RepID=A0A918K5A8_9GAMM|nr:STAS domain-containing protein [Saccharospirillum salsuginis]GGX50725.1 STAS domain-containing protein [Saccharospirillum salsuginis]
MTVSAIPSDNGTAMTIKITGRFDFSSHQEFRQIYENASPDIKVYTIDMAEATYLDSSALGMLLLLRDHAGGDNSDIRIKNCNEDVRKILTISNFGQLFRIE